MPELGMGLGRQPPQATIKWIECLLFVDLYQRIAAAPRSEQGAEISVLQRAVARIG